MAELMIYTDIGPSMWADGLTAEAVKAELDAMGEVDEMTVRINSVGGDVFHGAAIYNLIRNHPAHVRVVVDGLAASAASVIAMAGDEIVVAHNALMMIHNPYTLALGDAKELRKTAETLDKVKDTIISAYLAHTSLEPDTISDMMDEETWLTGAEAVEFGFATSVDGEGKADTKNCARPWIKNAPGKEKPKAPTLPNYRIAARTRLRALAADAD